MLGTPEQDAFISTMKWAAVTTLRRDGSPTTSIVFYAREGDTLIFSTTRGRLKASTLTHDPRIAVTALDEGPPYRYVTVEGTASIQANDLVPGHVAINRAMRGGEFTPPPGFEERLLNDGRVLIRVTASRVSGVVARR